MIAFKIFSDFSKYSWHFRNIQRFFEIILLVDEFLNVKSKVGAFALLGRVSIPNNIVYFREVSLAALALRV